MSKAASCDLHSQDKVFQKDLFLGGQASCRTPSNMFGIALGFGSCKRDKASAGMFGTPGMCVSTIRRYSWAARSRESSCVSMFKAGLFEANLKNEPSVPMESDRTKTRVCAGPLEAHKRRAHKTQSASHSVL